MSAQPTLKIDGTLSVETPSLRDALHWTDARRLPFGGFGHFALKGHSSISGGAVSLSNVNVELDGNTAEGVITLSTDRRTVQGTLAADTLDVTPYVSGIHLLAANEHNWDQLPITLNGFSDRLDLRISARSVKIASAQLGRTAVAANLRGGKSTSRSADQALAAGQGLCRSGQRQWRVAVTTRVAFLDVDLEACLAQSSAFAGWKAAVT
jgi:AsmA protein